MNINVELLIGLSFIFIITIEGIIVMKNFSDNSSIKTSNEGINLLFRFIANSFIYISALLIITTAIGGDLSNFNSLLDLSIGRIAIGLILAVDLITIIGVAISLIKREREDKNLDNVINQKKAKRI